MEALAKRPYFKEIAHYYCELAQNALLRSQPEEARGAKMRAVNPAFIPRNHRIEEVIEAAVVAADFTPFETLLLILSKPFEDQPAFAHYMDPPQVHERVCQTFCGT